MNERMFKCIPIVLRMDLEGVSVVLVWFAVDVYRSAGRYVSGIWCTSYFKDSQAERRVRTQEVRNRDKSLFTFYSILLL